MKTTNESFRSLLLLFTISALFIFQACEKEIPGIEIPDLNSLELCDDTVDDGETLTLENRNTGIDYIINCVFTVGGDLVIEPGVTIQFGTDAGIKVRESGSLQAIGTAEDQITFTGEDKLAGSWKGIFIDSNDSKNRIEQAKIEYAGGDSFNSNGDLGAVIVWADTYLNLNNTTISQSKSFGFNASYGDAELILADNTITGCESPMNIEGEYVTTISGGSYVGNALDAIIVQSDQITGSHSWTKLDVPYHLPAGLQVIPGGTLNILPGVIMNFGQDSELFINEGASGPKPSLIAVGTALEPIVFSSIDNTAGAWRGIYFDSPSTLNEIGFATIENASNSSQNGAIETWYGTVLDIHDVLFKNIQDCAVFNYVSNGSENTVTTSNLTFENVGSTICSN